MENGYPETSPATPPHEATAALPLSPAPPPEQWGDWVEFDASDWPRKTEKHYAIVPAACPGCEGACGLLVYVDRENGSVRRVEGNPHHPGSRGGICMASAFVSRIQSPDRIVQPLKRAGLRGEGIWQPIDWETALREIGSEIHSLLLEGKGSEIVLESGLSGPYEIRSRISNSWGGCTHNPDPPLLNTSTSPDLESARFILLIGAGSESAFVRHSKQIIAARLRGAKTAAINPHLSNAASQCDFWLPARPGSEATLLLAIVNTLLAEEIFDAGHLRLASDWQDSPETSFEDFIQALKHRLSRFTPGYAASVSGAPESRILATAREIGRAGTSFCSVFSGSGPAARALQLLHCLTGKNAEIKWGQSPYNWGLSPLVKAYFSGEGNPVWAGPGGPAWMEALLNEKAVGLHAAIVTEWNETAWLADYVLPAGAGIENYGLHVGHLDSTSYLSYSQPAVLTVRGRHVERLEFPLQPGEVLPEDEFWIHLAWHVDPEGTLGIRRHFESPYRPGDRLGAEEYYRWIFENKVPGLPEAAAESGFTPLDYMRRWGGFLVPGNQSPDSERTARIFSHIREEEDWPGEEPEMGAGELRFVTLSCAAQMPCTRSGISKWISEISHMNPVWIHRSDAGAIRTGDLVRVSTESGYFVTRAWVTDSIAPGVAGCSRTAGRWRAERDNGVSRWSSALAAVDQPGPGLWRLRQVQGVRPFSSGDADSSEIWWRDAGVPFQLVIPPGPEPARVRLDPAAPEDRYGDVVVNMKRD